MTSLRQHLNQVNMHERERAVERLQSRWGSSSRVIVDRPPSQPLSRLEVSANPRISSVKESLHRKDLDTGNSRHKSAVGRFQRMISKWTSGCDSPRPPSSGHNPTMTTILFLPITDIYMVASSSKLYVLPIHGQRLGASLSELYMTDTRGYGLRIYTGPGKQTANDGTTPWDPEYIFLWILCPSRFQCYCIVKYVKFLKIIACACLSSRVLQYEIHN